MDARYHHQMSSSISHLLGGQTQKLDHLAGLAGQQAPTIYLAGMAITHGYTWVLWMDEEDHIQDLSHLSHKHFAHSASPQLFEVVIISKKTVRKINHCYSCSLWLQWQWKHRRGCVAFLYPAVTEHMQSWYAPWWPTTENAGDTGCIPFLHHSLAEEIRSILNSMNK